jgi:hypothetical protein
MGCKIHQRGSQQDEERKPNLEKLSVMATFVKGNFVKVQPGVDWKWDQWSINHTNLCDKVCTVTDIKYEQWVNQLFIEVESNSGERLWFLDHHLVIVDNYDEIYFESIHKACEQLQHHESICKKLRDEILDGVFNPYAGQEVQQTEATPDDDIFNDWQEVTTKEVIPLPGNGGTMTTTPDPKTVANSNRNKVRKIKSLGKKITKKGKQKISGSLSSSWTLSDEELKELEEYIDSLPDANTSTSSRDIDIDYGWDDDWDWNSGNGD